MANWRNWSGSVDAAPARIARPTSADELRTLVAGAAEVRVTGAGHSFMPLCATDGLLLSLEEMAGDIEVCADGASAWVPGGWPIHRLGERLWAAGMSLVNQGDIDRQAIAGALSTGTHGTGRDLGSISTQALAFRLVGPAGETIDCDADHSAHLFQAARLGLGMMGVIQRVRLATLPAYRLRETIRRAPLAEVLEDWDHLARDHRHVEFFVFPYADQALLKILDPAPAGDDPPPPSDQGALQFACNVAARVPALAPALQRLMTRLVGSSTRAAPAWRIFPSERDTRFEEMEYEIPAANGADALRAAIAEVRRRGLPIIFPFEYRAVAADDIWLSPIHAGPCVSISFHQYAPMPWREAFAAVERVFQDAGGRPHWAKRHTLQADDVTRLYPQARRWGEARRAFDPEGKFMNADLRRLFAFSL
ncbi:MAG: FAD-binding protein [Caulobacteraceae bacterium]|nr:FAD-binding protein [Caulobacteraceae bacterium]